MMQQKRRKLFCEISPFTYKLARCKCILQRMIMDTISKDKFAKAKDTENLPVLIYEHKSLIRRKLGNVDLVLQENKATNLSIAAPKVNGILIKPGETFSFWQLVGAPSERKGYQIGLVIEKGKPSKGTGGGMCQFTNLIHWMVLHSPLDIVEYHHHDNLDLFPDFGRQVPFGIGTSVFYNYGDYRLTTLEIAKEFGLTYIDLWDHMKLYFDVYDSKLYYQDPVHLSKEGQRILANYIINYR